MNRQAMIQQAVLNAVPVYADKADKYALSTLGLKQYLGGLTSGDYVRCTFCAAVRKEYTKLVTQ